MDGLTAARRIHKTGARASGNLPIIAMTAHAMQEDRGKRLDAGMNDQASPNPLMAGELRVRWTAGCFLCPLARGNEHEAGTAEAGFRAENKIRYQTGPDLPE